MHSQTTKLAGAAALLLAVCAVTFAQSPYPVPPTGATRFQDDNKDPGKKNPNPDEPKKNTGEPKKDLDPIKEPAKKNPDTEVKADEKEKDKGDDKDKDKDKDKDEKKEPTWYSVHGQGTIVSQGNWQFRSPYEGPHSFLSKVNYRTTETATLYLAARLWQGGTVVFNPELSGGRGLSDTMGLAGFPNGEATRVGIPEPTPYVARLLFRQIIGFGGEQENVEDGPNEVAGKRDVSRLTFRVGKMGAPDNFDDNLYSHDPRTQFLNWSLMYNGAWDYPANVRGYTYGATLDLNQKDWALRYGVWGEPTVANGEEIDPRFLKANGHALEFEYRFQYDDHPCKVRLMGYLNNAHMGNYATSYRQMPVNPDVTQERAYRVKYGFGLNVEREVTKDFGTFLRFGWNDGHTETWAFTEIDNTVAFGFLLKGRCWCRPQDQVGLAFVANGLSSEHRNYLTAGGIGFIIGDGQLHYGEECIVETYYNWELKKGINLTLDFQEVGNPAYNQDRGPVSILGLRAHFEY